MAENKPAKCAHPGCQCPVPKGSKYCSQYCERAGKEFSIACNCGHGECAGSEGVGATG